MLQMLIDGQVSIREEMRGGFKKVNKKIEQTEKKLAKRMDKLGFQLAYLEDDAPTREEYSNLDKRVTKIEKHISSN